MVFCLQECKLLFQISGTFDMLMSVVKQLRMLSMYGAKSLKHAKSRQNKQQIQIVLRLAHLKIQMPYPFDQRREFQ